MAVITPKPEQFRGADFALGSIRGVRVFGITKEGMLTGLVKRQPWTPYINKARCFAGAIETSHIRSVARLKDILKTPGPQTPGHMMNCDCGFYGVFSNEDNHYWDVTDRSDRVCGVIEGFGITVQGPKGFKAEKARILGLLIPDISAFPEETHAEYRRRTDKLGRHRIDLLTIERMKSLYSETRFFTTYEEMVKTFPLTAVTGYDGMDIDLSGWASDGGK